VIQDASFSEVIAGAIAGLKEPPMKIELSRRTIVASMLAVMCAAGGCASTSGPHVAGKPGPEQERAMAKLKSLAGEWTKPAHGEMPEATIVYSVTAGGSAVREIMFPGTPHEMTNLYHADGGSIVCTHYCAAGNQPRMRAAGLSPDGKSIAFKFDSVTNLSSADASYMGALTLDMPDADHLTQTWMNYDHGKLQEQHAVFAFTRKK
jgi:hypothetical protein